MKKCSSGVQKTGKGSHSWGLSYSRKYLIRNMFLRKYRKKMYAFCF